MQNTKYLETTKRKLISKKIKVGLVHGVFDIMHIGHREILLPPMGVKYYFNNGIFGVHWIDGSKLNNFIDEVDWCHVKIV